MDGKMSGAAFGGTVEGLANKAAGRVGAGRVGEVEARLISVAVRVRRDGRPVRMRVLAEGVRQAVEMACPLDDAGRARLVLPIDGERFFVDGRTGAMGEILAENDPAVQEEPVPVASPRKGLREISSDLPRVSHAGEKGAAP